MISWNVLLQTPFSREQCANIFWTGGLKSGYNRWFDKSIQIVCTKNGKAGYVGEHSMMDGMPAVGLCAHITRSKYSRLLGNCSKKQAEKASNFATVRNLFKETFPSFLSHDIFPDLIDSGKYLVENF